MIERIINGYNDNQKLKNSVRVELYESMCDWYEHNGHPHPKKLVIINTNKDANCLWLDHTPDDDLHYPVDMRSWSKSIYVDGIRYNPIGDSTLCVPNTQKQYMLDGADKKVMLRYEKFRKSVYMYVREYKQR
jgi:hypothetical protein